MKMYMTHIVTYIWTMNEKFLKSNNKIEKKNRKL